MGEKSGVRRRRIVGRRSDDLDRDPYQEEKSPGWNRAACLIGVFAALILTPIIIAVIPAPIEPVVYLLKEPPVFEGPLEPNTHLQKAEHIYEDQVIGPESIVVDGDHIYTGTADGKILHIHKGEITVLARLGVEPCGTFESEPTCGRPLGMRLDKEGYLIVADAYLGLFRVNVATGDVFALWPSSFPIGGDKIRFLNDVAVASNGLIYMTDSSTKWDRRHNRYLVLEADRTGRLLEHDPKTNTTARIASVISFANGIQLSQKEDFLMICETTKARILKYQLTGPGSGEVSVFIDNLPGLPDNIRPSSSGGYWIGMSAVRQGGKFNLIDYASQRPWIRTLITKLFSQDMIMRFVPKYGLVIEVSAEGKILRSLHDPTGKVIPSVSEVEDKDGVLYLGSYNLPYMSRLYLSGLDKSKN
ncbi:adipocyte plasma membrane-associated protein-like [Mizuhopecten yessoensis]|uniref:Adipocyte plasma membrane-associated protein n=1 Tax=Mizuhopecten yessoensis TaxID=6573 RepID=A0A210QYF8_MIZYE|nr:adipocyte plasma membrane-associated protein-like [Mizuhopecten yessoensis]OWF53760.1 Adipocyte plasma membrane-associated protein [Mizuhopecten yessoensis]